MHVNRFRVIALLPLVLFSGACTGFPFFKGKSEAGSERIDAADGQSPAARALLEMQNVEYDGTYLSGRFLVGVAEGQLTIDKRLVENVSLQVESVSECSTGQPVGYVETDSFPQPAEEEDFLTLLPGYWYGVQVRFFLLDERLTGEKAPACIDVGLALKAANRAVAARLNVRAEHQTRAILDAGSPRVPPEDGGTP